MELLKIIPKNEHILEYFEDFEIDSFHFIKMGAYYRNLEEYMNEVDSTEKDLELKYFQVLQNILSGISHLYVSGYELHNFNPKNILLDSNYKAKLFYGISY